MNPLIPLISAILQAGSFTIDKVVLSMKSVTFKTYNGVSLPLSFLILSVIFLILRPPLLPSVLTRDIMWLIAISIIISIVNNILFYRALDDDHLSEIQTIELLQNLPVIFLSSIIFIDERKPFIIIPAIISSLILLWSYLENNRFTMAKNTIPYFVWSMTGIPAGALIAKNLLTVWNPISFELVRWGVTAVVLTLLFYKEALKVSRDAFYYLLLTNILSTIGWVLFYFSYQRSGIVYTTLIFLVQPILVYFASFLILKEKLHWKKGIAILTVAASIIIAQIL